MRQHARQKVIPSRQSRKRTDRLTNATTKFNQDRRDSRERPGTYSASGLSSDVLFSAADEAANRVRNSNASVFLPLVKSKSSDLWIFLTHYRHNRPGEHERDGVPWRKDQDLLCKSVSLLHELNGRCSKYRNNYMVDEYWDIDESLYNSKNAKQLPTSYLVIFTVGVRQHFDHNVRWLWWSVFPKQRSRNCKPFYSAGTIVFMQRFRQEFRGTNQSYISIQAIGV